MGNGRPAIYIYKMQMKAKIIRKRETKKGGKGNLEQGEKKCVCVCGGEALTPNFFQHSRIKIIEFPGLA